VENYLLRLGWGHGDDDIISRTQAISWFDTGGIGRSPSRLDGKKLDSLNAHYMRDLLAADTTVLSLPFVEAHLARALTPVEQNLLTTAMPDLVQRAKTLRDIASSSAFLFTPRPLALDDAAVKALTNADPALLANVVDALKTLDDWSSSHLDMLLKTAAEHAQVGLGKLLPPLRAALTGTTNAPGVAAILSWLGKTESLARLDDQLQNTNSLERAAG
jgi:glutamyl-tRNA synthetase